MKNTEECSMLYKKSHLSAENIQRYNKMNKTNFLLKIFIQNSV